MKYKKIFLITFIIVIIIPALFLTGCFLKPLVELKIDEFKINNNPNKRVELALITDKNYLDYTRVAIKSAIVNKNEDSFYNISILGVDLSGDDILKIKKLESDNTKINIIPLSLDMIKDVAPNYRSLRITRADLFKFVMPEILKDIDKVLYIDSDTVTLKDLLYFYNTDISNKYLAGVSYPHKSMDTKKIIGSIYFHKNYKSEKYKYNAGVMLLNLKKMREDGISKKLTAIRDGDSESTYNSIIPYEKIKELPITNDFMYYFNFDYKYKNKTLDKLAGDIVIIHYAGAFNPKKIPLGQFYRKYAAMVDEN